MQTIIRNQQETTFTKPFQAYYQILVNKPQNKVEKLPSGFTREELRQIVAEQID
ncbi:hypothetical protein [Phyllobacterium sp. YR531]|uniref:hypothetical protein n=1 Tax=Phyllobacterium sp. YR531 TaxID=1144343 RepID=UPI00026FAA10|nr:hypothetical protein [Phyllobacterium sp. YR531]EJN02268.1 hypothetical protein PMI41_03019 [Phyllobacterium sp. YR531]